RHILAVYTDRPTYRPEQDVQFKMIVRQLGKAEGGKPGVFRSEEFDRTEKLELPAPNTRLTYTVLNPRGQEVGQGEMTLNDFGTAAGTIKLGKESATGTYSLRVELAGVGRIMPEVFAVRYYRRPYAELKVEGVPPKLAKPADLQVELTAR